MERPEVIDPLKEEEKPILQQTPVEEPKPIETQTDDAFSVRGLAEKRLGKVGTGALDFVPIAGDILAAGDVVESYKKGDVLGTAINSAAFAVGLIPVVGDVAAKGLKAGLKATRAEKSDVPDIWSYPEQMYASSGTSLNQIPAGYKELKKRGELKKGQKVVDIGGGRFDKVIEDASVEGIDVKVFDPFNRTPEHNAAVADAIREGQADVAMSHNVLNVIKEDANINTVIQQAENAVKPGGKAHFSVYEGDGKGVGGVTQKGGSFQRNQKTVDYVPFVEEVFGAGNVTRKGKIITAVKPVEKAQEKLKKFKSPKGTIFKRGGMFGGLDFPVGKVIGGNQVYFHKNYIGSQPKEVQDLYNRALEKLPPDHNFNTLMYMKGKGDTPDTIRFDESADFDIAREPTPGKMIAVDAGGNVAERNSNQIFHHKWMWVGDDYKGFNVNKEYNWSKQWTSKVDNFSGIGKKENWDTILKEKGLALDEPKLNKGGAIRTYKEGGVVPMQEQMKFAFMNEGGVLADDGVDRDPVSGNEVPSGSMAKEVRDDVPAMLSEGEYVVPADVVRYHGIDKFEELRDEAKRGLARMEADGRIGGQPVEEQEEFPFPVEELQGFDEGGAVGDTYSDVMGSPFRANQRYGSLPTMGFELRNFTNPKTGQTVVVPFFNGQPMQYIPPDFLESGASTTGGGVSGSVGDDGGRQETAPRDTGMSDLAYEAASKALRGTKTVPQTKPFSEYSTEDFRRYVQTRQGVLGRVMDAIPVVGMLTSMQDNAAREFARRSLIQGKNIATGQPLTNNDAGVLMQVADLPKGRSVLSAIDDFLQGKTRRADGIVIDDTPPIDTELRRTTYEAEKPIDDTPAATTDTTKEKADTSVTEQDLPPRFAAPDFVTQGGGTSAPTQTVAEEAKGIIDYAWVVVPGVNLNKKFRIDKKNLHLVGASPNDSARAILATDKHGMFDPVLRKTTGKGNLIQVHSEGPENARVLSKEELARYSGANVNADASEVQGIIESNNDKINKDKKGIIQSIRNALDMSAGATEMPMDGSVLKVSPFVGGGELTPGTIEKTPNLEADLLRFEAGVSDIKNLSNSRSIRRAGGIVEKDGQVLFKPYQVVVNGVGETFEDGTAKYTIGAGHVLPKGSDPNQTKTQAEVENLFYEDLNTARNSVNNNYDVDRIPPDIKKTLVQMTFQLGENGLRGFKKMNEAIEAGNYKEAALQIKNNYQDDKGNYLFSTDPNVTKVSPTDYYKKTTNRVNTYANYFDNSVGELSGAKQFAQLPPAMPVGLGGRAVAQPQDVSQFYGQRFDPTQIDTDDMLRQAAQNIPAGSDIGPSFQPLGLSPGAMGGRPTPPKAVPQSTLPFVQGPPVAPTVGSPPEAPLSVEQQMQDLQAQISPEGALPSVSEPSGLGTFTGTSGTLPTVGEVATQSRRLGMSPGAMGGRQLGMSPGAMGGRAAPSAPTPDSIQEPKEEEISDAEYKRNVKEATDKVYDEARKRGDQARDEVLRQGGSVEEAYDAMHTAFTGFDRAGNMVSTDPGTQAMGSVPTFGAFKEGGLASKPKKTKPKKRNTKKGLGGKMAT